ncbi:unnamed protein product [Gordionus sp. m RMFG-2023]
MTKIFRRKSSRLTRLVGLVWKGSICEYDITLSTMDERDRFTMGDLTIINLDLKIKWMTEVNMDDFISENKTNI